MPAVKWATVDRHVLVEARRVMTVLTQEEQGCLRRLRETTPFRTDAARMSHEDDQRRECTRTADDDQPGIGTVVGLLARRRCNDTPIASVRTAKE